MNNIIRAVFNPGDDTTKAYGLYQWNYGQKLEIHGLDLPRAVEVHFAAVDDTEAIVRIGTTVDKVTTVPIPDVFFEQEMDIKAYVYLSDAESGQTIKTINLPMTPRQKPEAWNGSEETTMGAIMEAINQFAEGKADGLDYKDSILKLMSGEKELARVTIAGGSGGSAREIELQKSENAIQWRYTGEEEWRDLVLLEELRGDPGKDGEDGRGIVSVTIKADGHLQVYYSDGTNADVGKVVGENGLDGISGIPIRQEMTTEDTTVEIQPNKLYVFPEMTELTLTFAEPSESGVASEYHVIFQSGATATTLIIPDTIKIPDSFVIEANKIYELSLTEGCLLAQSWEVV